MDIQTVNKLFEDGTLTGLYKKGLISGKIFEFREIYLWVDAQCKARGISQEKAAVEAQILFKRSRTHIYNAIYFFD